MEMSCENGRRHVTAKSKDAARIEKTNDTFFLPGVAIAINTRTIPTYKKTKERIADTCWNELKHSSLKKADRFVAV